MVFLFLFYICKHVTVLGTAAVSISSMHTESRTD